MQLKCSNIVFSREHLLSLMVFIFCMQSRQTCMYMFNVIFFFSLTLLAFDLNIWEIVIYNHQEIKVF